MKKIYTLISVFFLVLFLNLGASATTQVYLIPQSQLVNCSSSCGSNSYYNDCSTGRPGFSWTDVVPGGASIISVTVDFNIGRECNPGAHTTTLNGSSESNFTTTVNWCTCTGSGQPYYTMALTPGNYVIGGSNSFSITNPTNCLGFALDASLSAYARVTVEYTTACTTPAAPSGVSASASYICPLGSSNLTGTSPTGTVRWYTSPAGGTAIGTMSSGGSFAVSPTATTTYYAESYNPGTLSTSTFNFTGSMQSFTVPSGVTSITVEAFGAQGGGGSGSLTGGLGASMRGDFAVTPGEVFDILVGGQGLSYSSPHGNENGGGGGSFFVKNAGTVPYLIAGGGGGGPSTSYGTSCTRTLSDAHGQITTSGSTISSCGGYTASGGSGGSGGATAGSYEGGAGGGFSSNGANGGTHCATAYGGNSYLAGGAGGTGNRCYGSSNDGGYGGGGGGQLGGPGAGGGYSGGGSAASWSSYSTYGGGGGSYNIGTSQSNSSGVRSGNGLITVSYYTGGGCVSATRTPVTVTVGITAPSSVTASPSSVYCPGTAANLSAIHAGDSINWYTSASGGTKLGTSNSGENFVVNPTATTTYYAETKTSIPAGSTTFNYTGSAQTFTVPSGITSLTIDAYGAQGMNNAGATGGRGGRVQGTLAVTSGSTLNVYVGGQSGYNGGGAPGTAGSSWPGVYGGGASDIRVGGTALTDRVLVASGGGGAGSSGCCWSAYNGGDGGGASGSGGGGCCGSPMAGGASSSAGGVAGYDCGGCGYGGTVGTLGQGGTGSRACSSYGTGSGGGGGYYGGGGGATCGSGGSGGGGSSYTGGLTGASTTAGARTGNGVITISWAAVEGCTSVGRTPVTVTVTGSAPAAPTVTATPSGLCSSGTVQLNAVSSGSTIFWYTTAIGGSSIGSSASGVDFPVSLSASSTYYAEAYDGTCYSTSRTPIAVAVGVPSAPSIVTASPSSVCIGSSTSISAISVGARIDWYDAASGGSLIGSALSGDGFSVTPSVTTTYYAEAYNPGGCSSPSRTALSVTVNPLADAPTVTATPSTICPGGGVSALNAISSGNNINWYTAPTGGSSIGTTASGVNFSVSPSVTTTYYAEAVTDPRVTTTFNYTGSMQSYTVPSGVTSITIEAFGAQGGGGYGINLAGGRGARMKGTFAVTPGEVFDILVGGQGQTGTMSYDPQGNENGGGGGSFVVKNIGTVPYIIAGGGGGGPSTSYGSSCTRISSEADGTTSNSGVTPTSCGGYTGSGGSGGSGGSTAGSYMGGAGGGFSSNGANGGSHCATAYGGNSYLSGGAGGTGNRCYSSNNNGGYGGGGGGQLGGPGAGGGYSGGGTSASWSSYSTYGGGGGSYNIGTAQSNSSGVRTGNGQVLISYSVGAGCPSATRTSVTVTVDLPAAPTAVTATAPYICAGGTSQLNATSTGNNINWYTSASGGSPIGTSVSGADFAVTPSATTTYYAEAAVPGPGSTTTFNYTGSLQTFTVPAGVTSVTIDAYGAEGGTSTSGGYVGGLGARSKGDIAVTPGQVLSILVGQRGSDGTCGSGGGGGSFVVRSGSPLVIAGGGGGGFYCSALGGITGGNGLTTNNGGDGRATPGRSSSSGGTGGNGGYAYYGGGGGGFYGAGSSSSCSGGGAYPGTGGSPGGGYGGGGCYYSGCCGGSGGGGGYSGGSGGPSDGTAGGGGGSYNVGTSQTMTSGVRSGNGLVTITYSTGAGCSSASRTPVTVTIGLPGPTISASPSTICPGALSNLNATYSGAAGIYWYTVASGGSSLDTTLSGENFAVNPTVTTTYYAEANTNIPSGSYTFNYTGSAETLTIPAGITSVTVDAYGAQGSSSGASGGLGARVQGTLAVTPGDVLNIYVGGQSGYNGGGTGGTGSYGAGASGGGATDVRIGGTALSNRVLVAGGGGGGGTSGCCWSSYNGGVGGISPGAGQGCCGTQATAATSSSGGSGGLDCGGCGYGGTAGTLGQGGNGSRNCSSYGAGSGGGGGYYGGGGGNTCGSGGSGAGGTSYLGSMTSTSYSDGVRSGNGTITISWSGVSGCITERTPVTVTVSGVAPSAPTVSVSPTGLCSSGTAYLNGVSVGNDIYWYTDSIGGSSIGSSASGVDFSVSVSSTTTYYAASYNGSCYSITRTPISISVGIPSAPSVVTASPSNVCVGFSTNLSAISVGNTIDWFDASSGGTLLGSSASGASFSILPSVSTTYYAEANNPGGCVSPSRTAVSVTVNPLATAPSAATATPSTVCPGGGVAALNATSSGNTIAWYTVASGGSSIGGSASGADFSVSPAVTTTYYAESVTPPPTTTSTFNYTGAAQTFTVPAGVTSIVVDAYGAQGSNYSYVTGGQGARVQGTLAVTPGQVLNIYVGGQSGFNGGGTGGSGSYSSGVSGGGATDIRIGGISLSNRVLVAGGGGGAGNSGCCWSPYNGGNGGMTGGAGQGCCGTQAYGASSSAGGVGGLDCGGCGYGGTTGTLGQGGNGSRSCSSYGAGSGGGGGYYGGGGGNTCGSGGSGGGGSSYLGSMTSTSTSDGARSGDGRLTLTYSIGAGCPSPTRLPVTVTVDLPAAPISATATPTNICPSATSQLSAISTGNNINWYTVPTGGTAIGTSASGDNFAVSPSLTTTYYAEAAVPGGTTSVTFNYTGSMQSYTVPSGVTSITIDAYGAEGGTSSSGGYVGGLGARSKGDIAVTPGDVIDILVGQRGSDGTCGAGGGGGSFVVRSGSPLVIAGGGGGGFYCSYYGGRAGGPGQTGTSGQNGINTPSAAAGAAGGTGGNGGYSYYGGGGGGFSGAGSSSSCSGGGAYPGSGGSPGGGYGGGGCYYSGCCGGAGGGGGYSGGSGGTSDGSAGGGGGSYNVGTSQTMTSGVRSGNGTVTISYSLGAGCVSATRTPVTVVTDIPAPTAVTASPSTVCPGATSQLNATSLGNNINWYTVASGGTAIGTSASGADFAVNPLTTTTYYAEAAVPAPPSVTSFNYTGSMQTFTVPSGVTSITVEAFGAQGGGGISNSLAGGRGARMRGTFTVVPGEVFNVLVGGQGQTGSSSYDPQGNENGGGGGSFFVKNVGTVPYIIAGGGGGGPSTSYGYSCSRTSSDADGQTGTSGVTISCYSTGTGGSGGAGGSSTGSTQGGAGGGFSSNGGNGGSHCATAYGGSSYIAGGAGGTGNRCYGSTNNGGYGGGGGGQLGGPGAGGGYSGGGTSGGWSSYSTYGGGGGSYNSGTAQSNTAGARTGNGLITVTYSSGTLCTSSARTPITVATSGTAPAAPTITPSPAGLCSSGTVNLNGVSAGNDIYWYSDSVGGSPLTITASGVDYTVSLSSTTTYYAASYNGSCYSTTRTAITIPVGIPSAPTPTTASPTTVCAGSSTNLTSVSPGNTIYWYTAASGGSSIGSSASGVAFGVSPTVATTYYAEAVNPGGCSSASRTGVSITVNPIPAMPTASDVSVCTSSSATLTATGVGSNFNWYDVPSGGSPLASTASYTTPILSSTTLYYVEEVTVYPTSSYVSLIGISGASAIECNSWTGDDRGGIVVTSSYVYLTGDGASARFNKDLSGGTSMGVLRDQLFADLSGSGQVYSFANSGGLLGYGGSTVDRIQPLDANLSPTGSAIMLSSSITTTNPTGIYSGLGFVILHTTSNVYRIALPSGTVTNMTFYSQPSHTGTESWAWWGWAENNGVDYSTVYVQNSNTIARMNMTTGAITTAGSFSNLSDMANIIYSPWENRWYFHHEGGSQFRSGDETVGYADATIVSGSSASCPGPRRTVTVTVGLPSAPSAVTATPVYICAGGSSALNATSLGNNINWYTDPSGGTSIGTSASAVDFTVSPSATTTYYAEAVVAGPTTTATFNYTGAMQSFTVPSGVTSVTIDAYGAQGSNSIQYGGGTTVGGQGGRAQGTLAVTPGQVLNIFVGAQD